MSIILDALRKSESERQRQAGAGIADAGFRPAAPRRSAWIPLLVIVLIANLVAVGAFWWRGQAKVAANPAASPTAPATAARPPEPEPVVVRPASAARIGGTEETSNALPAEVTPAQDNASGRTEILEPPVAAGPVNVVSPPASGSAGVPTADQMMAGGLLSGTPLHIDLHVYSSKVSERFVMINMRRYTEGAEMQDGIRVTEITPDGVILTKNGMRFLLPRE